MSLYFSTNRRNTNVYVPLDLVGCEVGVVDFYAPESLISSLHRFEVKVLVDDKEPEKDPKVIPITVKSSWGMFDIVHHLHDSLSDYASISLNSSGLLEIVCKDGIFLMFPHSLSRILGMPSNFLTDTVTGVSHISPQLYSKRILIMCNFANLTQISNSLQPCIFNGPTDFHTSTPTYYPAQPTEFGELRFWFTNFASEDINLDDYAFSLHLHIRKSP
jgi:hypothetical protein